MNRMNGTNDYAVIKTGGKQYLVEAGDKLEVEKIKGKAGDKIELEEVLLTKTNGQLEVGKPTLPNKSVKAKLLEQKRGKKIRVAKFKAKSRYRRVQGHRQSISLLEILSLS